MNQATLSFTFVLHVSVYIMFSLPLSHQTLGLARGFNHGGQTLEGVVYTGRGSLNNLDMHGNFHNWTY